MVDTITGEDVTRVSGRVPADARTQADIEDILKSKFDTFSDKAVDKFAEEIADRRPTDVSGGVPDNTKRQAINDKTAVSGEGATGSGSRTTMLRDSDGQYFGSKSEVSTYTDRWGNVMGYNESTGKRKKIVDSSEVNQ